MKITGLEVDGFGVWSSLRIEELTDRLHVFYGANEAGKTTLMQFVRTMLYGFSAARRTRYLPPLHGGRNGGTLDVATHAGQFRIARHLDHERHAPTGELAIYAEDGSRQGDHFLNVLLAGVDETIFENLFAIGLREIQELGSLTDVRAAELLYKLSTGVDRVSLVDVLRELTISRERILAADERPSQITALLAESQRIEKEIDALRAQGRHAYTLMAERDRLSQELIQAEARSASLGEEIRAVEAAAAVFERWNEHRATSAELAALGEVSEIPEKPKQWLSRLDKRLRSRRQQIRTLEVERHRLLDESAALPLREALWRERPRIEALAEQQTWIESLTGQVAKLDTEVAALEQQAAAEHDKLGMSGPKPLAGKGHAEAPGLSALRAAAKQWGSARARLKRAKHDLEQAELSHGKTAAEIRTAMAGRNEKEIAESVEKAGSLVAQLRRRVQLDQKLDELARQQEDLAGDVHDSMGEQLLPWHTLAFLGGVGILGIVLIVVGLFFPERYIGGGGWALAIVGLFVTGLCIILKIAFEHEAATQLETNRNQLDVLAQQLLKTKDECEELDRKLPRGGGPITARLQTAEKEYEALEDLLEMDGRRQASDSELAVGKGLVEKAAADERLGRRRWQQAVNDAGLPEDMLPNDLNRVQGGWQRISDAQSALAAKRQELSQCRRDLVALEHRVRQVAADVDVVTKSERPLDQLRELVEHLRSQQSLAERRSAIRKEVKTLACRRTRLAREMRILRRRQYDYLSRLGVRNTAELDHLMAKAARLDELAARREALDREIKQIIAGRADLESVELRLEDRTPDDLTAERQRLSSELLAVETTIRESTEQRGRLGEQIKQIVDDRRLAERMLDLATVEQRLRHAIEQWQVLAVCERLMDEIRRRYELERQPETLREASDYLRRLTGGNYTRVWTPFDQDVLKVDDAAGRTLSVDTLSRGTREQLFLSLRLALTSALARRGANLPLVLDDVLVNFDDRRAKSAMTVLRDFAAAGHQVLLFTCHEHMLKLTRSLKIPCHRLPAHGEAATLRLSLAPPVELEPIVDEAPPPARPPRKQAEPRPKVEPKPRPAEPLVEVNHDGNGVKDIEPAPLAASPIVTVELPLPRVVPPVIVEPARLDQAPMVIVESSPFAVELPIVDVSPRVVETPLAVEPLLVETALNPLPPAPAEVTHAADKNGRVRLRPRFWAPFEGSNWQEQVDDDTIVEALDPLAHARLDREHYWFGQARGPICEQTVDENALDEEFEREVDARQTAFVGLPQAAAHSSDNGHASQKITSISVPTPVRGARSAR